MHGEIKAPIGKTLNWKMMSYFNVRSI